MKKKTNKKEIFYRLFFINTLFRRKKNYKENEVRQKNISGQKGKIDED
jgi:hypothetical protein